YDPEDRPLALHWGRWSLDPLGSAWPANDKGLTDLEAALEAAVANGHRGALKKVSAAQARLAARAHLLEQLLTRQQYSQALDLIPLLLDDAAQSGTEEQAGL